MDETMSESKHTAIPWTVEEILDAATFQDECRKVLLIHSRSGDVAYAARFERDGDNAEQKANAAFIVEACNSHDALKARNAELEEALKIIAKYGDGRDGICPFGCDTPFIARAALAKKEPANG